LTTPYYILYDHTARGHKGTTEYVCNVNIYIQCTTFLYNIFIYDALEM
jgi:hypothetical protein